MVLRGGNTLIFLPQPPPLPQACAVWSEKFLVLRAAELQRESVTETSCEVMLIGP